MPDRLSLHAPILVNTIGHCAGAIAFGILFYPFLLDWRRATAPAGDPIADTIIAGSFSVLSLLPAVLLHIFLQPRTLVAHVGMVF